MTEKNRMDPRVKQMSWAVVIIERTNGSEAHATPSGFTGSSGTLEDDG
jgi:hypothetical protein